MSTIRGVSNCAACSIYGCKGGRAHLQRQYIYIDKQKVEERREKRTEDEKEVNHTVGHSAMQADQPETLEQDWVSLSCSKFNIDESWMPQ